MKLDLKNITLPKASVTPERIWSWAIIGIFLVFILGLIHAGIIFKKYGTGGQKDVTDIVQEVTKLNVGGLEEVISKSEVATSTAVDRISNPFLSDEEGE